MDAQLAGRAKAKINLNRTWHGSPLRLSPEAQYHIAQANYLLGNYEESLTIHKPVIAPELFKEVKPMKTLRQPVLKHFHWYAASLYKPARRLRPTT